MSEKEKNEKKPERMSENDMKWRMKKKENDRELERM